MSIAPGRSKASARIVRCPACGQRLGGENPVSCPLCKFSFGDARLTGDDATPYAHGFSRGAGGWGAMAVWVWLAGAERLKHLALMRASVASRRFARLSVTLVVMGATIALMSQIGWHRSPLFVVDAEAGQAKPVGDGWHHVVGRPRPLSADLPGDVPVDLWWNSFQALLGLGIGLPLVVLASWLTMTLLRAGVTRAHRANYRAEQRMTAGLHYSTAWGVPLFAGLMVMTLIPLARAAEIAGWTWCPPDEGVAVTAAVVGGFALVMWWVWLMRLGATAPAKTRARVLSFFAMGTPLIVAAIAAGWGFGTLALHRLLTSALRLTF